jgi:hypothetical protein
MRSFKEILTAAGYDPQPHVGPNMGKNECLSVRLHGPIGELFADVLVALNEDEIDVVTSPFRRMRLHVGEDSTIAYFPGMTC